jgi:prepilin-type N-terminal cleavage/methylation domain-containing protein
MILSMFINTIKDCHALKNRARNDTGGYSLLEMTVVLIIISILTAAVIPQLIKQYTVNAANKVALDMSAIEEAGRAYYIANNSWPASIAALQTANYLPSSWNGINPFGYSAAAPSTYGYNISSTASLLTVNTYVPVAAQPIIQNLLPVTAVSGNIVYSSVPVPGGASGGFGTWVAESVGTTYQAATDGFVVVYNYLNNNNDYMYGYTDSSSNPTTLRAAFGLNNGVQNGVYGYYPFMFPVRKGDYYKVITPGFSSATMYFLPA